MLTDDEIDKLGGGNNYPGTVPGMRKFARAIIAAYQAKLRQGVELPDVDMGNYSWNLRYTQDQLLQYGDARDQAGHLRGLETALLKVTGLSVDAERCKQLQLTTQAWEEALDNAAAAIEQLKEQP